MSEILKRTFERYQGPVLWAWLEFFSFLRGTNSETIHYILSKLNALIDTAKAPIVDLLRLSTPRGTKTAFLIHKRYDWHPRPFHVGVPPSQELKFICWVTLTANCMWLLVLLCDFVFYSLLHYS